MDLLVKGVDNDLVIEKKDLQWIDAFTIMDNITFDINYGKYNGSLFVLKLDNGISVIYENDRGKKEIVSKDLFYRMQRKNPEIIKKIKSITGE